MEINRTENVAQFPTGEPDNVNNLSLVPFSFKVTAHADIGITIKWCILRICRQHLQRASRSGPEAILMALSYLPRGALFADEFRREQPRMREIRRPAISGGDDA